MAYIRFGLFDKNKLHENIMEKLFVCVCSTQIETCQVFWALGAIIKNTTTIEAFAFAQHFPSDFTNA